MKTFEIETNLFRQSWRSAVLRANAPSPSLVRSAVLEGPSDKAPETVDYRLTGVDPSQRYAQMTGRHLVLRPAKWQ
ncbi:unnamed protein product [Gadus morhua 'NCC']